jgi:hypothetical protein
MRFPSKAYLYGGGTFIIPWVLVTIFLGWPLLCTEMAMGQQLQQGIYGKGGGRLASNTQVHLNLSTSFFFPWMPRHLSIHKIDSSYVCEGQVVELLKGSGVIDSKFGYNLSAEITQQSCHVVWLSTTPSVVARGCENVVVWWTHPCFAHIFFPKRNPYSAQFVMPPAPPPSVSH